MKGKSKNIKLGKFIPGKKPLFREISVHLLQIEEKAKTFRKQNPLILRKILFSFGRTIASIGIINEDKLMKELQLRTQI